MYIHTDCTILHEEAYMDESGGRIIKPGLCNSAISNGLRLVKLGEIIRGRKKPVLEIVMIRDAQSEHNRRTYLTGP